MTEFPELQHALVDAARRRHRRAPRLWRLLRPVLVAGACAAAVAAVVILSARASDDERPAAPAIATVEPLEQHYAVFRRPATGADILADANEITKRLGGPDGEAFDPAKARLVVADGPLRVFLVGALMNGRPSICVFVPDDRRTGLSCGLIAPGYAPSDWEVTGGSRPIGDSDEELFVAAVADGVDEVVLAFADGSTQRLRAHDNAVNARLPRRPTSFTYTGADGRRHSVDMPPSLLPGEPPPDCIRPGDRPVPGRPQCPG